jgi:hypothetical protein
MDRSLLAIEPPVTPVQGPVGGFGGADWAYPIEPPQRLSQIWLRFATWIDAIAFTTLDPQTDLATPSGDFGGEGGGEPVLALEFGPTERLIGLWGTAGAFINTLGFTVVDDTTGQTRHLTTGGDPGPAHFAFTAPPGWHIHGFVGRAATYLDAIGVVYAPAASVEPVENGRMARTNPYSATGWGRRRAPVRPGRRPNGRLGDATVRP